MSQLPNQIEIAENVGPYSNLRAYDLKNSKNYQDSDSSGLSSVSSVKNEQFEK